ncbi:hypothetical protein BBJ28_00012722 [Nothophytophthora sp. Chile5]|nr:hypothetical protein BBJ28_00012722 [Nothophytophthora sp. Chile5]
MLATLRLRSPPFLRAAAVTRRAAVAPRSAAPLARLFSALVDSEWVRAARDAGRPKLLLLDCNHPVAFPRGHIPQAVPLTLASSMLKDPTPDATGVVSKEQFQSVIEMLQVPSDATLVFYDDEMIPLRNRSSQACDDYRSAVRLAGWCYECQVLDGGLKQWLADANEAATGEPEDAEPPASQGVADPATQFVDARSPGEYWGEDANGNARTGHVPGAVNSNWVDGVDFARNGKFKSKAELEAIFSDVLHLDKDKPVITYCQRGIRAAHTAFALDQVMGFKDVKIYEDSMLQYLNRDDSDVEQH